MTHELLVADTTTTLDATWEVRCSCGWRTASVMTEEAADSVADAHSSSEVEIFALKRERDDLRAQFAIANAKPTFREMRSSGWLEPWTAAENLERVKKAEASCAEMRAALEGIRGYAETRCEDLTELDDENQPTDLTSKAWDALAKADAAIASTDLGKGWASPKQVREIANAWAQECDAHPTPSNGNRIPFEAVIAKVLGGGA